MSYTLVEKTSPHWIPGLCPVVSEITVPEYGLRFYRNCGDAEDAQADVYRGEKHLRTLPMKDNSALAFRRAVREFCDDYLLTVETRS